MMVTIDMRARTGDGIWTEERWTDWERHPKPVNLAIQHAAIENWLMKDGPDVKAKITRLKQQLWPPGLPTLVSAELTNRLTGKTTEIELELWEPAIAPERAVYEPGIRADGDASL